MGKHANDKRNYNPHWEKEEHFAGWLCRNRDITNVTEQAYCRVCRKAYRAHHRDLIKHAATKTHRDNFERVNPKHQPSMKDKGVKIVSPSMKAVDIILSVFVAMHCATRCVDHLGEVAKKLGSGSVFQNLKLHRTKCSKIILNVLAPSVLRCLVSDVNNSPGFSILIDESTDVTVHKYMAFCVKFFCVRRLKLVTEFLGLVEVHRATAEALSEATQNYLNDLGIDITTLVGIGTDGASNMCGKNNSLFTRLKSYVPKLQLVTCICHSLHLACCSACTELPSHLECLIRDSRAWFECSPLRKSLYESFYKALNCGQLPKQLVKLVVTRWLAMARAVSVLLEQWQDLKDHFNIVANSRNKNEKCHMARILSSMFNDVHNRLYFLFLSPILDEVQTVNLLFQSANADPLKLFDDLRGIFLFVAGRVIKPGHLVALKADKVKCMDEYLSLPDIYLSANCIELGAAFKEELEKHPGLAEASLSILKERCRDFLICLTKEIAKRISTRLSQLESINAFAPQICTRQVEQPLFKNLPLDLILHGKIGTLESQWLKLPNIKWKDHMGREPTSSEDFWKFAFNFENAGGQKQFHDIACFAFRALSLPISNAAVERIFSALNCIKTKKRNRMGMEMLVALLRIRFSLLADNICCTSFEPSEEMLRLYNASIYDYVHGSSSSSSADAEEEQALDEELHVLRLEVDDPDVVIIDCV